MTARGRRAVLAGLVWLVLAVAVVAGTLVARAAARRAAVDLLRAETGVAVELLRETGRADALDHLFGSRWALSDDVDLSVDEAIVRRTDGGLTGVAAVYDADAWSRVGTLRLTATPQRPTDGTTAAAVVAVALLGIIAMGWTRARSSRVRWPVVAAVVTAVPLAAAGRSVHRTLEDATSTRLEVAANALRSVPDLQALIAEPGGVYRVAQLPFVAFDRRGDVILSTLSTTVTARLGEGRPAGGRLEADRVTYAIADVGPVRLAGLPYEHTHDPTVPLIAIGLIGLALAAAIASLARLVDTPRAFRRTVTAWSFLAPAFLHLGIFSIGPLLFAAWLSLHRWSLIDAARPFVGLANYAAILTDPSWWNTVQNTAVFTLHVPIAMAVALGLALLAHRPGRGVVLLRAVFFLPSVTSLVAIAIVWQWMLHDEYGFLNWVLSLVGLGPVRWLTSPDTALLAIMLMSVWLIVGYQMVLFQAGLAAVRLDLYDAARIDGAGPWRRFVHVTLPGLRHTLFFVFVTSVIGSFQIFGAVYVMTEGGPLHSTDVAVFHIYEEAWEFFRFGNAAAMSWVLFAIIFVVTWLQFRVLERRVEEGS
ncbi:MAG: sugar ABC transporter permease [Gemmatimonadetes bacterium]|nr:sugar ABC transporter permease [Gemmatimonadota bacterium]